VTAVWIPDDTALGARLALIRHHHHWNIKKAAATCGITPQTWRTWEQGDPPRHFSHAARRIAERTGCDETWLLNGHHHLTTRGGTT
jgi:transcriptional regulator with XRE-family HTH domain